MARKVRRQGPAFSGGTMLDLQDEVRAMQRRQERAAWAAEDQDTGARAGADGEPEGDGDGWPPAAA
jgi:hypothetical protein